ncbi:hypothetical protein Scep_025511 [Stephania cephalantha]|uniref:Uncharacterized protein n=1 Tax=Stephania cephalantha TaxID=152367 RepID=A0AAP0ELP1_9MAGN
MEWRVRREASWRSLSRTRVRMRLWRSRRLAEREETWSGSLGELGLGFCWMGVWGRRCGGSGGGGRRGRFDAEAALAAAALGGGFFGGGEGEVAGEGEEGRRRAAAAAEVG